METTTTEETPAAWAVVELMGHTRTGGRLSKDNQFGTPMLRLDVPNPERPDDPEAYITQFINPSSIYRVTLCEEAIARVAAKASRPMPVHQWELPQRPALGTTEPEAPTDEASGAWDGDTPEDWERENNGAHLYEDAHLRDDVD